jgi:dihydrodipicolinate reductase
MSGNTTEGKKGVTIFGTGNLGLSLLKSLMDRDVPVSNKHFSIDESELLVNEQNMEIITSVNFDSSDLELFREKVSCVIVTVTGAVLEKEIDFLLRLQVPLIIMSTKFDEELIKSKIADSDISVMFLPNGLLAIIDFWKRLQKLPMLGDEYEVTASLKESHQQYKQDPSGTGIDALNYLKQKGFKADFDFSEFIPGVDGYYGCVGCIRVKRSQLNIGVAEEFLDAHGYHTYRLNYDRENSAAEEYMQSMYDFLISLENYSIPGVFTFKIYFSLNGLVIIHNMNGRDAYAEGVVKSMIFLEDHKKGVYSVHDLIN